MLRMLRVERHEWPALAWAFAYFFLLLAAYYVLRPVRDASAAQLGGAEVQKLFVWTFAAMLALVPLYGGLCAQAPAVAFPAGDLPVLHPESDRLLFFPPGEAFLRLAERVQPVSPSRCSGA